MGKYDTIINLPAFEPKNHPRMSIRNRACQFAPFAALTGFDDAIDEAARAVDAKIELDDTAKAEIDEIIRNLDSNSGISKKICVTYFIPDTRKSGGKYVSQTGIYIRSNAFEECIYLEGNIKIMIDDIISITGKFD